MSHTPKPPTTDRGVMPIEFQAKSSYSSVDWLTITTDKKPIGMVWSDIFVGIAANNGHEFTKTWSFWGFNGWQTDHCRYGHRPTTDEYILIVSSSPADDVWLQVCPTARSITRIDLAVTTELERPKPGLPYHYYLARHIPGQPTKTKYSLIQNSDGGQTLYIGSRKSEQFGRVYDKSAERKEKPGSLYRYEVVLRKDIAPNLVKSLLAASMVRGNKQGLSTRITGFVWDWFDARYVTPVFDRGNGDRTNVLVEASFTTAERKLQWLNRSVSPTVRKLMAEGKTEEVMRALSLEAFIGVETPENAPQLIG